jgi:hypothetical protein
VALVVFSFSFALFAYFALLLSKPLFSSGKVLCLPVFELISGLMNTDGSNPSSMEVERKENQIFVRNLSYQTTSEVSQ